MNNTAQENIVFYRTPCFLIYNSPEYKEYPTHWHNAVEILMPTENIFPVFCGGREYVLQENDILIIPPGELHSLSAQKGRRIIMLCDSAMLCGNPALSELNSVLSQPVWINGSYNSVFISELNDIIIEMAKVFDNAPPFCETILFGKFINMLLKIAEYRVGTGEKDDNSSDIITLTRKYIDSFYMNPVSLDTLAAAIGYSKYHISRTLNNNDTSFNDMLNARRIRAAENLLYDEKSSVTQTALNSGFSSITTFNRVFRRIKGCTPTEFRELYRERNG